MLVCYLTVHLRSQLSFLGFINICYDLYSTKPNHWSLRLVIGGMKKIKDRYIMLSNSWLLLIHLIVFTQFLMVPLQKCKGTWEIEKFSDLAQLWNICARLTMCFLKINETHQLLKNISNFLNNPNSFKSVSNINQNACTNT